MSKYVRLADHLARGMRADLTSGFSISGFNVVEMPDKDEQPRAYEFVKAEIAAGRMEEASKAEFDEVHPDLIEAAGGKVERPTVATASSFQETHIQDAARKARQKVTARREGAPLSEAALEADEERRKAALKAQKAAEKGSSKGRGSKAAQKAAEDAEAADRAAAEAAAAAADDDDDEEDDGSQ